MPIGKGYGVFKKAKKGKMKPKVKPKVKPKAPRK